MATENKRVLAVGAHPDDVEIMCSGTLFALRRLGYEIHVASMTLGDCGSTDYSAKKISQIRYREAQKACEVLGASYHQAGFSDLCIFYDDSSNRQVTALLRNINPWIVITHSPQDYMSDHEMTSLLIRNACFYASIPNYETRDLTSAAPTSAIPYLYYAQPVENIDLFGRKITPQFYVDVSGLIEQKIEMLSCHKSQRNWLREHHGMDEYVESMRRWNASLAEIAVQISEKPITYAEAFRQHLGHAYPKDNVLAALFGEGVIPEPDY